MVTIHIFGPSSIFISGLSSRIIAALSMFLVGINSLEDHNLFRQIIHKQSDIFLVLQAGYLKFVEEIVLS